MSCHIISYDIISYHIMPLYHVMLYYVIRRLLLLLLLLLDYVVMYAADEASIGQVVVKNLKNSEQTTVSEESLVTYIKDQLTHK